MQDTSQNKMNSQIMHGSSLPQPEQQINVANTIDKTGILPEEEALFREFQEYTRSIYAATTKETIQKLDDAVVNLKNTIEQSRNQYKSLFDPAIQNFDKKTKEATHIIEEQTTLLINSVKGNLNESNINQKNFLQDIKIQTTKIEDISIKKLQEYENIQDTLSQNINKRLSNMMGWQIFVSLVLIIIIWLMIYGNSYIISNHIK